MVLSDIKIREAEFAGLPENVTSFTPLKRDLLIYYIMKVLEYLDPSTSPVDIQGYGVVCPLRHRQAGLPY